MVAPRMKRVWDNMKPIGEVMKTDRTKLVVELVAKDGVKGINLREWYCKKSDNIWTTYGNGFFIPLAIPINGQVKTPAKVLMQILNAAIEAGADFALEDEANAVWAPVKVRD